MVDQHLADTIQQKIINREESKKRQEKIDRERREEENKQKQSYIDDIYKFFENLPKGEYFTFILKKDDGFGNELDVEGFKKPFRFPYEKIEISCYFRTYEQHESIVSILGFDPSHSPPERYISLWEFKDVMTMYENLGWFEEQLRKEWINNDRM